MTARIANTSRHQKGGGPRGAEGLPVSMGAHLSCRSVAEWQRRKMTQACQVQATSQSVPWHEEPGLSPQPSRLIPAVYARLPPARLLPPSPPPPPQPKPSPAQPSPRPRPPPFLQLMRQIYLACYLSPRPCPTYDIITTRLPFSVPSVSPSLRLVCPTRLAGCATVWSDQLLQGPCSWEFCICSANAKLSRSLISEPVPPDPALHS